MHLCYIYAHTYSEQELGEVEKINRNYENIFVCLFILYLYKQCHDTYFDFEAKHDYMDL